MTDEPQNTGNLQGEPEQVGYKKPPKSGQLKKGYDPRRNLKGVPKDTIEARKMIRKIGAELLTIKEKNEAGEVIEYELTRYEAMVRLMYSSRNPAEKIALLKALSPGLLKDEVDLTSGGEKIQIPVIIEVVKTAEANNE